MQLTINNLSKTYPNGVAALQNISLTIPQGMFGLLGPNGAGKTTLMRTIAGLQAPDEGSVFLDELDVLNDRVALRRVLGYLPQEFGVYPRVNAQELLDHMAIVKGIANKAERKELVAALLEKVNLFSFRKRAISSYSGGMKQRFGIAQALIGDPLLLIVDEPTAGLDPGERNRFYNILSEIGEDRVVILSTHIVDDVKELCSKMAIINKGRLLYTGAPDAAIADLDAEIWACSLNKADLPAHIEQHQVISTKLVAGKPLVHVHSHSQPGPDYRPVAPTLEDVFFTNIMLDQTAQAVPA